VPKVVRFRLSFQAFISIENRAEAEKTFANFAPLLTRHFIRHSFNGGGSSKNDGWFAAK